MTGTQPEPAAQLSMQTANGVARAAALSVTVNTEVEPVGIVAYQSAGRLLVVGSVDAIASATAALAGHANISCTGLASESAEILLSGYLGHFELQAGAGTPQVYYQATRRLGAVFEFKPGGRNRGGYPAVLCAG